jgi:hypothetical protein
VEKDVLSLEDEGRLEGEEVKYTNKVEKIGDVKGIANSIL